MFKNQPKGLLAAALANMGERFGFYTMMAILSLFLQSKFGLDEVGAGWIYSSFYFSIYAMALLGGIIADGTKKYKTVILCGLVAMSAGYLLLAMPTTVTPDSRTALIVYTCVALFVISFGNGLFKGNLQALVGQMYDNPQYSQMRDRGFSIFYMFINIGAVFAPFIAPNVRNWWLAQHGFNYNAGLPALCHEYLAQGSSMAADKITKFSELAQNASVGSFSGDLGAFASQYLNVFNTGFHYSFAVAIVAMAISVVIYLFNVRRFPDPAKKAAAAKGTEVEMSVAEMRQRIYALLAVFAVVIFFWFSFHQNGLTLTYFAKDYTLLRIGTLNITAENFQSANPFFVVFLTPLVVALFGALAKRGKEPSAPRKIAIGMGIAALGFVIMALGSYGLPSLNEVKAMGELPEAQRVTPWLLIATYFVLTVAELFISPLGISFVSKVAPPKLQGVMQGLWLLATGLGNQLLILGAVFYKNIPIWATWTVFVAACFISMFTLLAMVKWLERVAK